MSKPPLDKTFDARLYPGVLVLLSCFFMFPHLGSNDLSVWDEAYYASRAAVVATQGEWIDQSALATGGLWTGSHPPLAIWAMALSVKVLGMNEWALRIPSVFGGIACVLLVFLFARSMTGDSAMALFSAVTILLVPLFLRLARMAQLDILPLVWILLALVLYIRANEGQRLFAALSGLAFGLALMSKIAVGFFVIMIIGCWVVWEYVRGDRVRAFRGLMDLLLVGAVGLLVAMPWHWEMTRRLGVEYWNQAYGYHVFARMGTPLEGASSPLGMLFWPTVCVNKLGGLFPFTVLGMLVLAKSDQIKDHHKRILWSSFIVPFLVFTITASKRHNYLLLFLPPLAVFTGLGIRYFISGLSSPRLLWTMLPLSLASLVWSQTFPLHRGLESVIASLRVFRMPEMADVLLLVGFGASVGLLIALSRFHFTAKPSTTSRKFYTSYGFGVVMPAILISLGPLIPSKSPWKDALVVLDELAPKHVVYYGRDGATAAFYLTSRLKDRATSVIFAPDDTIPDSVFVALREGHQTSLLMLYDEGSLKLNIPTGFSRLWNVGPLSAYRFDSHER